MRGEKPYEVTAPGGRVLKTTPVFDSYWRFAALRQDLFHRRSAGLPGPWTTDPVLRTHRFTNAYRASDRVSQYLIRNVIYRGSQTAEEVFFRTILFKIFNKIETWEALERCFGTPAWDRFDVNAYSEVLDAIYLRKQTLYSAAYIMPSPPFGMPRKHRNHLLLLEHMMRDGAPAKMAASESLKELYELLLGYPSLGAFLAFQFAIDLNYSEAVDFSEMEFVVAGPGARDGIRKCFSDTAGMTDAEVIRLMADRAEFEFDRMGLKFVGIGSRPLQLIDCQNLFCEVDKYARVVHPEISGVSGRARIKQKFRVNTAPLARQWYPPKWGLNEQLCSDFEERARGPRTAPALLLSAA